jgi:hypothetical protein
VLDERTLHSRRPIDLTALPFAGVAAGAVGSSDPISLDTFERGEMIVGLRDRGATFYFSIHSMTMLLARWQDETRRDVANRVRNPYTNLSMVDPVIALYQVRQRQKRRRSRSASPSRTVDLTGGRTRRRSSKRR